MYIQNTLDESSDFALSSIKDFTRRESIYIGKFTFTCHLLYQRSPSINRGVEGRKISGARKSTAGVYNAYTERRHEEEKKKKKKKQMARGARKVKEGEGKVGRRRQGGAWRWRGRSEASFRGVMYRRNFKVKKTRGSGDEVHVFLVEKLHGILRPNVSVSPHPSGVIPPAAPFHSDLRLPFSFLRFRNRFS